MVVVPDSLDLITPYVLQEQGDWFEDEIKFVRELMQPNERAMDIGANYGLYTLSMANRVGPEGHVWAFEPASSTVSFLRRSIELNKFRNTTVVPCALSDRSGEAKLSLNPNSELNSLCHESDKTHATENVVLTTLDRYVKENGCERLEFVKLDAEGEESNIIEGGSVFFAEESPLIMYELKHGDRINLELIHQFDEMGYRSYRLIPGLNILAPYDPTEPPDTFQLNLFCCKKDRARLLEKRGILADSLAGASVPSEFDNQFWKRFLEGKPFARNLLEHWARQVAIQPGSGWEEYKRAIELFSFAHDPNHDPNSRYMSLQLSCEQLAMVCKESPTLGRLCTYARVSGELGYRAKALKIIRQAISLCIKQQSMHLNEPFLPVSKRFDSIDPENRIGAWLIASLLEQLESLQSFSSFYFYTKDSNLQNLDVLVSTGFASPEMGKRLQLIQMRHRL